MKGKCQGARSSQPTGVGLWLGVLDVGWELGENVVSSCIWLSLLGGQFGIPEQTGGREQKIEDGNRRWQEVDWTKLLFPLRLAEKTCCPPSLTLEDRVFLPGTLQSCWYQSSPPRWRSGREGVSLVPSCADLLVSWSRYRQGSCQGRFGHAGVKNLGGGHKKAAIIVPFNWSLYLPQSEDCSHDRLMVP